ncbi:MAG: excinuclease ABC subunit A [Deltaproteobacteria bacterium]|nr:excinuclease ABC subunit A [Deltaproteobacteria bacterium]
MLLTGVVLGQPAQARDTLLNLNAQAALEKGRQTGDILSDVKVYFAGEATPAVEKKMGEFKSNKKTNAFNKSDEEACQWAFFSAVKSLQERALKEGGNAVVDVKSNYRDKEFVSATEFQCGAGAFIGGVALKGTVAKLK